MMIEKKKTWYWSVVENKEMFLFVFKKRGGPASVRIWDAERGILQTTMHGPDTLPFVQQLEADGIPLVLEAPPNVARDCRVRLPIEVLRKLQADLRAVQQGDRVPGVEQTKEKTPPPTMGTKQESKITYLLRTSREQAKAFEELQAEVRSMSSQSTQPLSRQIASLLRKFREHNKSEVSKDMELHDQVLEVVRHWIEEEKA